MSKKTQTIKHDEWVDALFPKVVVKPEGFFTCKEIAARTGRNLNTVMGRMRQLAADGKADVMKCLIDGKMIYAYKVKK